MIPPFRDRDDMDIAGARKKRQRGAKRVASFKTAIPGNDGCASCIESLGRIRNKQDGRRSPHDNDQQVWAKVEEEIEEFKEIVQLNGSKEALEDEFGDILFSLINFARYKGIDPETSLERVNLKFKRRFEYIESRAPKPLKEMTLGEMDAL